MTLEIFSSDFGRSSIKRFPTKWLFPAVPSPIQTVNVTLKSAWPSRRRAARESAANVLKLWLKYLRELSWSYSWTFAWQNFLCKCNLIRWSGSTLSVALPMNRFRDTWVNCQCCFIANRPKTSLRFTWIWFSCSLSRSRSCVHYVSPSPSNNSKGASQDLMITLTSLLLAELQKTCPNAWDQLLLAKAFRQLILERFRWWMINNQRAPEFLSGISSARCQSPPWHYSPHHSTLNRAKPRLSGNVFRKLNRKLIQWWGALCLRNIWPIETLY